MGVGEKEEGGEEEREEGRMEGNWKEYEKQTTTRGRNVGKAGGNM